MFKPVKYLFALLWLVIILNPLHAQLKQSHSVAISFLRLKDKFNLEKVFNGIQVEYRYGLLWNINDHEFLYEPKLAFGFAFNNGMSGTQIKFAPANLTWTMPFYDNNGHKIKGGFNLLAEYAFQAYPKLHNDRLFWMSEIGVSPRVGYNYQWDDRLLGVSLQNFLFGFSSRTNEDDMHYRSLSVKDLLIKPHEEMKFESFNTYYRINAALEFSPSVSEYSFIYEFDYLGLFYGVPFERLNHSLLGKISL